nr:heavy metal-binding domain-containing protein [Natrinema salinisoli]
MAVSDAGDVSNGFEDGAIPEYCGVISGEACIGSTVGSGIATGVRDAGGQSGSDEKNIETGRTEAIAALESDGMISSAATADRRRQFPGVGNGRNSL